MSIPGRATVLFVCTLVFPSHAFVSPLIREASHRIRVSRPYEPPPPPSSSVKLTKAVGDDGGSSRHSSSNDPPSNDDDAPPVVPASYTIQVWYEGRSCNVTARSDETILAALEGNLVSGRLGLPNHAVPSDCRRGNCLTCTGTHATLESREAAARGSLVADDDDGNNDGLSPHMSRELRDRGYVLTCSARVGGEGLQLVLGEHDKAWDDLHRHRLEDDAARAVGWAAMAMAKRRSDERNVPRWTKQTEALLEETSTGNTNNDDG